MLIRFIVYGLVGWCSEVVWTAVRGFVATRDWRLQGHSYLWMFPIYGLIAPLFEPLHNALRQWPWPLRGLVYMAGFWLAELITGYAIRRLTGRCPWDYSGRRGSMAGGIITLAYAPVWFLFGLAMEPLHDRLVWLTPYLQQAF